MNKEKVKDNLLTGANPYVLGILKNRYTVFLEGSFKGLTLSVVFFPFAIAFSIVAQQAGLSFAQYYTIGIFVYAGSAQLIAFGMLMAGISFFPILLSALICNLRYFLLVGSMSEMTRGWSRWQKGLIYFFLTDESFALFQNHHQKKGRPLSFAHSLGVTLSGVVMTSAGLFFGNFAQNYFTQINSLGFEFAAIAVFVAMLALNLNSKKFLAVALLSGTLTLATKFFGLGVWSALFSTMLIALSFACFDLKKEQK